LDIGRVSDPPHAEDPRQLWIASGVVVDTDGDGVPDWRYGVDNMPLDKRGSSHRWWRTDLHTGRTESAVGDDIHTLGDSGPVFYSGSGCDMSFGAETTGDQHVDVGLPERFYAWASVIENGRVVATDYAPDVGWLDRSPDAKPLPKPGGPFVVQDLRDPDRGPFPDVSMTIPDGWTLHGWAELTRGEAGIQFGVLDDLEDDCTEAIEPPVGPGLDNLVGYLKTLPYIDISEMRYDTLDGYRTAYLEYRSDDGCLPRWIAAQRKYSDVWILDVDGVRLAIAATYNSEPAETIKSEVRQIVESIHIEGVSPS
jgi:hypothetical protein